MDRKENRDETVRGKMRMTTVVPHVAHDAQPMKTDRLFKCVRPLKGRELRYGLNSINKVFWGIVFVLGIGIGIPAAEAPIIKIAVDEWCPYSCNAEKEEGRIGYVLDILLAVFQSAGFQVETKVMPYTRVLNEVRQGNFTVVAAMGKDSGPEFIFSDEPIGVSACYFYVAKGVTWQYQGFESLSLVKKFGLVQDYAYEMLDPEFARFLKDHPANTDYIAGEQPLERNLRKLVTGRVDTVLEDQWVTRYVLKKMNLSDQVVEAGRLGTPVPVFVGFSPAIPQSPEYAKILQAGIDELRKTGKLQEILSRYGVEDWTK